MRILRSLELDATSQEVNILFLYSTYTICDNTLCICMTFLTTFTGEGVDSFWKVLVEGRNCVVQIQDERFDTSEWFHPDESKPGKTQTTKAALIDG